LLKIFALSLNIVIERSHLLKELCDDEGVIVSRRLDMFISKLHKMLEGDPGIRLVNVQLKMIQVRRCLIGSGLVAGSLYYKSVALLSG
jgi:DNA-binding response OmpR family regulator